MNVPAPVPVNPNRTGMNPQIHVQTRVSTKNRIRYLFDIGSFFIGTPPVAVSLTEDQGLSHRTDQLLQNHAHKMHLIRSSVFFFGSYDINLN